ncbi:MAG: hypothetical protein KDE47_10885, partial [Caldilineaceae bacterium]|nr:hypothetical protein [Caldilineaceae bacterium]
MLQTPEMLSMWDQPQIVRRYSVSTPWTLNTAKIDYLQRTVGNTFLQKNSMLREPLSQNILKQTSPMLSRQQTSSASNKKFQLVKEFEHTLGKIEIKITVAR